MSNRVNRNTLPFPFNIRTVDVGLEHAVSSRRAISRPIPSRSEEFNRGAYLVEGLGHCGACHTPLNAFGANKADQYLQGNQIDNWIAPNITNDPQAGLGNWSVDDIVQYLKTGQTRTSLASGPMKDVIENSTSKMPDADLKAIAVYLKERGAAGSPAPAPLPATDPQMQVGEAIFTDTCSACHAGNGAGVEQLFPRLAGNADRQAGRSAVAGPHHPDRRAGRPAPTRGRPRRRCRRSAIGSTTARSPPSSPISAIAGATRRRAVDADTVKTLRGRSE